MAPMASRKNIKWTNSSRLTLESKKRTKKRSYSKILLVGSFVCVS